MRRAPGQILAGVPGPRGCPRIQGGDVPRALGGPEALERSEVVERLAVLPEPLESRLISSRKPRAILFQILHRLPRPESSLAVDTATYLREQHTSNTSCSFLQL